MDLLVATRKGLFTLRKKGRAWRIAETAFLGDNVTLAMRDPRDGATYAALEHGHFGVKMHRRDRRGKWKEIAAPAFPQKPEGLVEKDGWGRDLPWTVMKVWSLASGAKSQKGLIWCGTIPGALFVSRDRGDSWQWVKSLWDEPQRKRWMGGGADWPGIHSICVDPRDADTVRIAVSCGGVWRTRDCGRTWKLTADGMRAEFMPPEQSGDPEIQDAHMMVQSPSAPDRLWVQHHNGIFRSDDAGEHWTEITGVKPSGFGFAVAVHPRRPDTAWFVPGVKDEQRYPPKGRLVVTRTRDGGRKFKTLSKGLPQDHAYDVVWRHGLTVDDTGERLAFGSTTGGLWISGNGGGRWREISHTLPPIHCVRWA